MIKKLKRFNQSKNPADIVLRWSHIKICNFTTRITTETNIKTEVKRLIEIISEKMQLLCILLQQTGKGIMLVLIPLKKNRTTSLQIVENWELQITQCNINVDDFRLQEVFLLIAENISEELHRGVPQWWKEDLACTQRLRFDSIVIAYLELSKYDRVFPLNQCAASVFELILISLAAPYKVSWMDLRKIILKQSLSMNLCLQFYFPGSSFRHQYCLEVSSLGVCLVFL